jgi:hypothetical protein
MKFFALVIHYNEVHLHVSLHRTREAARKAGAERCLRLIMEDSIVDLGDNPVRMHKELKENNYDEVIRAFEAQQKRRCVFVREAILE